MIARRKMSEAERLDYEAREAANLREAVYAGPEGLVWDHGDHFITRRPDGAMGVERSLVDAKARLGVRT